MIEGDSDKLKIGTRTRLLKTALINISMFGSLGVIKAIPGPTLLDLKDIYDTSVEAISIMFVLNAIGSVLGSFLIGYIMDKFCSHRNLIMFFCHFGIGLVIASYPFLGNLNVLFAISLLAGVILSGVDVGGNIMCLHLWRENSAGGHASMHSIHFTYGLGAFVAPLIAAPFLSQRREADSLIEQADANQTVSEVTSVELGSVSRITTLFPVIGIIPVLTSLGFLYYEFQSWNDEKQPLNAFEPASVDKKQQKFILISAMTLFYLLFNGVEYMMGTYLTTFAVKCQLRLSRSEGAHLAAVYFLAYSLARLVAIFMAVKLSPLLIMVLSLALSVAGGAGLVFLAESSLIVLQVCVAVIGAGIAPIFANGFLWLEQHVEITSKIAALLNVASALGHGFTILVGQFIVEWPMFLMHLALVTMLGCVVLFFVALCAAHYGKDKA